MKVEVEAKQAQILFFSPALCRLVRCWRDDRSAGWPTGTCSPLGPPVGHPNLVATMPAKDQTNSGRNPTGAFGRRHRASKGGQIERHRVLPPLPRAAPASRPRNSADGILASNLVTFGYGQSQLKDLAGR